VIAHYNQQRELDLVLSALDAQDYPPQLLQVVVADDGSASAPTAHTTRIATMVVGQQDRGFRAAAVRNLGAAQTDAEVLCFLDADTIPQPDYVRRIVALPSVSPEALIVGRRRHADFSGWSPQRLRQWWAGGEPPVELDEPRWLSDEYSRTRDLLELDERSYRYVISSVMCSSAELFREIGGFDESFERYGGEDWDFAHRAMVSGALVKHERSAVAWHSGPDWAGRELADREQVKNAETLAVARLVPDSELRIPGLMYDIPAVAVRIDVEAHGPGSLLACIRCFLDLDVGVWVCGTHAGDLLAQLRLSDPRIHRGAIPDRVLRRCRYVIDVAGRATLPRAAVSEMLRRCAHGGAGAVTVRTGHSQVTCSASWARHRARRWGTTPDQVVESAAMIQLGGAVAFTGTAVGLEELPPDFVC
jgi:GT2 family glycosyltransferase